MSKLERWDLVRVKEQFAPYGGQLGVVTLIAYQPEAAAVIWPLGGRTDHRLCYMVDEIEPVQFNGQRLNVEEIAL